MNFNCVFPDCKFKKNNTEEEFEGHLKKEHYDEIFQISKKKIFQLKWQK